MSRRQDLETMKVGALKEPHPGLWLDKYVRTPRRDDKDAKRDLVREVAGIRESPAYQAFFDRWRAGLQALGAWTLEGTTRGRMVVGLGAESVLETSILLHRTYGVPYIPGSALKGLAAHYADRRLDAPAWRKKGRAYQIAFGDTSNAGYVTFLDALPLPGKYMLRSEVMTVHHPNYYDNTKIENDIVPPADWDSPNPVPFLSAKGTFLVALAGPDAWVDRLFKILRLALEHEGVGAKTSSGYGRVVLSGAAGQDSTVEAPDAAAQALLARVRAMAPNRAKAEIDAIAELWRSLTGVGRRQVAEAILGLLGKAGAMQDRKWRQKRPWVEEMERSRDEAPGG